MFKLEHLHAGESVWSSLKYTKTKSTWPVKTWLKKNVKNSAKAQRPLKMKSKKFNSFVILGVILLSAYWYWSPWISLKQMQSAAQSRDIDAFNQMVDYAKLKESIKSQMTEKINRTLNKSAMSNSNYIGLDKSVAAMLIIQFTEEIVQPDAVMATIQNGEFTTYDNELITRKEQSTQNALNNLEKTNLSNTDVSRWSYRRLGINKFTVFSAEPKRSDGSDNVALILERSGFFTWKLSGVQFGSDASSEKTVQKSLDN